MYKTTAACLMSLLVVTGDLSSSSHSDSIATALDHIRHADFRRAYDLFAAGVLREAEGSVAWQEAIYGQAVCAEQVTPPSAERRAEARQLYEQLLAVAPESRLAPRVWMDLGRMEELTGLRQTPNRLAAARDYYGKVLEQWPNESIAGEATLRIAATWVQAFEIEQVKRGVSILQHWLASHPNDPLASAMWQYLGQTFFYPLESYEESLACYLKADRLGLLEPGRAGIIYWRMATMADRLLGKRDVAAAYYTKIVTDAPTSGKAYEAQLALRRLKVSVPDIQLFRRGRPDHEGQDEP